MSTVTTNKTKFKDVSIERGGSKIILPPEMTYAEGRLWLERQEQAEEQLVEIYCQIPGFPLDAAVALQRAMNEVYGFTSVQGSSSFFGSTPPMMVQVPIAGGKFETAILGKLSPPTWEGGYLSTMASNMALVVKGVVKRKHEEKVKSVLELAKKLLLEQSIYKGHAVILDLSYLDRGDDFHPINDAPKFMDLSNIGIDLLLNRETQKELDSNVFMLIEDTEWCRKNRVPLKHGCVLAGPFGTGKSLTARKTAEKCERNGWTFFYLKTISQFAMVLKLAEHYAPTAVFIEDGDAVLCGERDAELNNILNTMDGIDTKDKPIITILTTNHPEKINPAAQRPGRIDSIVVYTTPDADTAVRFVEALTVDDKGKSILDNNVDRKAVGKSLAGFVPATITEAIQKAKRYARRRIGTKTDTISIITEDLVDAALTLKARNEMLLSHQKPTNAENALEVVRKFGDYLTRNESE